MIFREDCQKRLEKNPLRILDCKIDAENEILKKAPTILDYLNDSSKERFDKVLRNVKDVQRKQNGEYYHFRRSFIKCKVK